MTEIPKFRNSKIPKYICRPKPGKKLAEGLPKPVPSGCHWSWWCARFFSLRCLGCPLPPFVVCRVALPESRCTERSDHPPSVWPTFEWPVGRASSSSSSKLKRETKVSVEFSQFIISPVSSKFLGIRAVPCHPSTRTVQSSRDIVDCKWETAKETRGLSCPGRVSSPGWLHNDCATGHRDLCNRLRLPDSER